VNWDRSIGTKDMDSGLDAQAIKARGKLIARNLSMARLSPAARRHHNGGGDCRLGSGGFYPLPRGTEPLLDAPSDVAPSVPRCAADAFGLEDFGPLGLG